MAGSPISPELVTELHNRATQLRIDSVRATSEVGSGHPGLIFSLGLTLLSLLVGCGGDESGGIANTSGGSPGSGRPSSHTVSVSLAWDPVPDPSVHTYFVHYGKQSSGQRSSCNYAHSTPVRSPSATITGLDPNAQYFFAVSASNGLEGTCSNEVSTITPPAAS